MTVVAPPSPILFAGGLFARGARVMIVNRLAQPGTHHVRVDLRGSNIGMTEHGLHATQIGPAFQQMSCKGVPQNMRAQIPE
jgi:hypothetical protein